MSTFQWLLGLTLSLLSPWLALPAFLFLVWAIFAVRIGMRHHLTTDDIPDRAEEWIR